MKEKTDKTKIFSAYARTLELNMMVREYTSIPPLDYGRLIRAVANSLKVSLDEVKSILEKNSKEFAKYLIKHSS